MIYIHGIICKNQSKHHHNKKIHYQFHLLFKMSSFKDKIAMFSKGSASNQQNVGDTGHNNRCKLISMICNRLSLGF